MVSVVLAVAALRILCFAIQRNFGGQPLLLERMLQAMLPSGAFFSRVDVGQPHV